MPTANTGIRRFLSRCVDAAGFKSSKVAIWLSECRSSPLARGCTALANPFLAGSLGQDEPGDEAGQENEWRCHGHGEHPS